MFIEIYDLIIKSAKNISNLWPIKIIFSIFLATLYSMHMKLISVFAGLVLLDLLSKWIALAYKYKKDTTAAPIGFAQSIWSIPKARRAGYIRSNVMKKQFVAKMAIYILVVLGATLVDFAMVTLKEPTMLVVLVVGYLTATEFISILENLQEAGVKEASLLKDLVEKIRSKK